MAQKILDTTSGAMEELDVSIKNVGFLTINDHDVFTMMLSDNIDYGTQGILQNKMVNLLQTNPILSSAYLLNQRADWVVGSPRTDIDVQVYSKAINSLIKDQKSNAVIRLDTHKSNIAGISAATDDVISYVFFQTRQSKSEDSFLIINIKQTELMRKLFLDKTDDGKEILILNSKGKVVFSKDSSKLYVELDDEGYVKHILESKLPTGYFEYNLNGEKSVITFVNSEALGYKLISITPYEIVRKTAIAMRNRTIVLSLIILLASFGVAILIARNFYKPLRRLINKHFIVDGVEYEKHSSHGKNEFEMLDDIITQNHNKVDSLDSFMKDNLPVIKQDYLKNILEGRIAIDNEITQNRLLDMGMNLVLEHYQVIYFDLDHKSNVNYTAADLQTLKMKICMYAEEAFSTVCNCEMIWRMSDDFIVALMNYSKMESEIFASIRAACLSVQEKAYKSLDVSLTAVIGRSYPKDVRKSFVDSKQLLSYKIKYGSGSIIYEDKVEGDIEGHDLFPEHEEKNLIKSLRSLSADSCIACIRKMTSLFYGYSTGDILRAVNHVLYSTFQVTREMIKNKDVLGDFDYFSQYESLLKFETLQDFEDSLISLYLSIIEEINDYNSRNDDSRSHLIRKITDFVEANNNNPSMSIELAAEYVKLNPTYLGKVFKEGTGNYFTEYVNQYRLEKAKKLLVESDDNISSIAEQVGFNSTPYFVTCFKKHTGMTPAKFRTSSQEK